MRLIPDAIRVRIAAPSTEARRLATRFTRGGILAAADDGTAHADVLVAFGKPDGIASLRPRANQLVMVGAPGAPLFAAGADEVVVPGEPEILFRRVRAAIERIDMAARLERLATRVQALEQGLADAAHDLRSPLHAAIGHADLLSREEGLTEEQRRTAAAASRQADRALQLAERILEGARCDRAQLHAGPCEVGELIEAAAASARGPAKARGVLVTARALARPVELSGDHELLSRLLDNLIGNAIKASPRGATVEVSAWRSSPKHVRFCVHDQGEGLGPRDLPKLVAGLGPGRGLRISRGIAEKHGGDLWAESEKGDGCRFYVELPLALPSQRPHVLLVSDDVKWVREMAKTLRHACDVRHSSIAMARLGGKRTDLILVDTPRRAARSLAALREAAKGLQVPVVDLPSEVAPGTLARTIASFTP